MHKPYDLIADQWHTNRRARGDVEHVLSYVDRVLEGLPTGAKVLDLGCGTGEPVAKYIVERGFTVTGVDESSEMLKFARQAVPEAESIHADIVTVELADIFDGAVALGLNVSCRAETSRGDLSQACECSARRRKTVVVSRRVSADRSRMRGLHL